MKNFTFKIDNFTYGRNRPIQISVDAKNKYAAKQRITKLFGELALTKCYFDFVND